MNISFWIKRSSSKTRLLTPTDGALGLHLANLSSRCGTGSATTDGTHRSTDGGADNDTGGTNHCRAALPLLLHPLVRRVGLGHGVLLHVCIVHDEGIVVGGGRRGRNEGGGGIHLVLKVATSLAAGGSEKDKACVDNGITRAVDGGRGRHDELIDWEVVWLL